MADAMPNLLDSASAEAFQNLSPIIASLFAQSAFLQKKCGVADFGRC
jgi:hypothetical protein